MTDNSSEETPLESMSFADYARHRGISHPALSSYIKREVLPKDCYYVSETGKYRFYTEICDTVLDNRTSKNMMRSKQKLAEVKKDIEDGKGEIAVGQQYAKAKASKEAINARLAQLELQEKEGKLVAADDVKKEGFELARNLREQIFNIPNRISAILAAEPDPRKCFDILSAELRQAFETIDKKFTPEAS